jgi:hypothetical protein
MIFVLDKRSAPRLALLLIGVLFARGRRTVTSWFRAAGITDEFRLLTTLLLPLAAAKAPSPLACSGLSST